MRYLWKDNIHIFHLAPILLKLYSILWQNLSIVFASLTDPKEFFPENGGVDGDGKKIVGDLGDFIDESDDLDVSDEDDEDEEVRFFGIKKALNLNAYARNQIVLATWCHPKCPRRPKFCSPLAWTGR